jgi:hypothetical protein
MRTHLLILLLAAGLVQACNEEVRTGMQTKATATASEALKGADKPQDDPFRGKFFKNDPVTGYPNYMAVRRDGC